MGKIALLWFRQDLRLRDNTALRQARAQGYAIIPVFILDDISAGPWKRGGASRWWLHESLKALNADLQGTMVFRAGNARDILPALAKQAGAQAVFWNRCYEPWRIARDKEIKEHLKQDGIAAESFKDSLLWEPWEILKDDGTQYKVFTPFYRKGCLGQPAPAEPASPCWPISCAPFATKVWLEDLRLLPDIPWYTGMAAVWRPGEAGAQKRLQDFLSAGLRNYKELRNRPDLEHVSRLSPHLHFGEISPREVWHAVRAAGVVEGLEGDADFFCSEMGWREFSYSLLYHNPDLPHEPLQKRFKTFPWDRNDEALDRWRSGRTGIPIVDAGMRQLWQTGWMHNRVRMIVASFLVKNLLLHWRHGEDWFWDCLVDADLANNAASWQWVAGCGADAAPYFRIFNPVTQGEKFDPDGAYVRQYVPEFGTDRYPAPLVDLKKSRERALQAFEKTRQGA